MESLNKHQLILLTLLISFVTSIATGVMTFSLMDEAPPQITQTINRVVERTVEKVVPGDQGATVVTKETTVVVKEEDLITDAIDQVASGVVRVYRSIVNEEGLAVEQLASLGIPVREDIIAIESSRVALGGTYTVDVGADTLYPFEVLYIDEVKEIAFLTFAEREEGEIAPSLVVPTRAGLSNLKLGQSIVSLGGNERDVVSVGIISSVLTDTEEIPADEEGEEPSTRTITTFIQANTESGNGAYGSPLFTIFGELIGIHTRNADGGYLYLPVTQINASLSTYEARKAPATEE